jgi:hypothetical protein
MAAKAKKSTKSKGKSKKDGTKTTSSLSLR